MTATLKTPATAPASSTRGAMLPVPGPPPSLTRIVATIGPASSDEAVIERLIDAGVCVFRLNFSHGTIEEHAARLALIRTVARRTGSSTAVLGDLQGPKIRVGRVVPEGIILSAGDEVVLQREPVVASVPAPGKPARFSSTLDSLVDDIQPGHRVLINDGAIRMLAIEHRSDEIHCRVTVGGLVTSSKGINLPDTRLSVRTITDRDWGHVDFAIEHDLDFLALSFVRTAADVEELREGIMHRAQVAGRPELSIGIVAKIEVPSAIDNIDAICDTADGIMVARGDLGVEMDLAQVPVLQAKLIATAQHFGKPVIVATQMLESMISSPSPTRAEVSDVATAIMAKADAVMLSAETATGAHPVLAVEHIRRIALHTEAYLASLPQESEAPGALTERMERTAALAHGAWLTARDLGAACVVVWSQAGGGARRLSQNNFSIGIVAATSDPRAARQMQLLRGVTPLCVDVPDGLRGFTRLIDRYLRDTGRAEIGDRVILLAGEPLGRAKVTNRIAILEIGDPDSGFS